MVVAKGVQYSFTVILGRIDDLCLDSVLFHYSIVASGFSPHINCSICAMAVVRCQRIVKISNCVLCAVCVRISSSADDEGVIGC